LINWSKTSPEYNSLEEDVDIPDDSRKVEINYTQNKIDDFISIPYKVKSRQHLNKFKITNKRQAVNKQTIHVKVTKTMGFFLITWRQPTFTSIIPSFYLPSFFLDLDDFFFDVVSLSVFEESTDSVTCVPSSVDSSLGDERNDVPNLLLLKLKGSGLEFSRNDAECF